MLTTDIRHRFQRLTFVAIVAASFLAVTASATTAFAAPADHTPVVARKDSSPGKSAPKARRGNHARSKAAPAIGMCPRTKPAARAKKPHPPAKSRGHVVAASPKKN